MVYIGPCTDSILDARYQLLMADGGMSGGPLRLFTLLMGREYSGCEYLSVMGNNI